MRVGGSFEGRGGLGLIKGERDGGRTGRAGQLHPCYIAADC